MRKALKRRRYRNFQINVYEKNAVVVQLDVSSIQNDISSKIMQRPTARHPNGCTVRHYYKLKER